MRQLQRLLHDRRRRQRGSVLSGLLIIVAFLSILIGALLTEVTDAFVLSRVLVTRVQSEATVSSAVELAINKLQNDVKSRNVPTNCAQDKRTPPPMAKLNGQFATVTQQKCTAIVPEVTTGLASGSYTVDGVHDTVAGRNRYLVGDTSERLTAYPFGSTAATWSIGLGGSPTAPPLTIGTGDSDDPVHLLVPVASHAGCSGACVAVFNDAGGAPAPHCILETAGRVNFRPAAEVAVGATLRFPSYAFIADAAGNLYVYDTGPCGQAKASTSFNGWVAAGPPLVFPGKVTNGDDSSVSDEIFVLLTNSSGTKLQHWRYTETTNKCQGQDQGNCNDGQGGTLTGPVDAEQLSGGNAAGYATDATGPTRNASLNLAVVTSSGWLDLAQISVDRSLSYGMSKGASSMLPTGTAPARAPYWCNCPNQDLIGVGGSNGVLYLFDTSLNQKYSYDGRPDGLSAINTTPMADGSGDWYFGASNGYVYDVEIQVSKAQLFKAATFGPGPGHAIASSPIVGTCSSPARQVDPCMYFGSDTSSGYFARIGATRLSDLRACLSSAPDSTNCVANPRLWAHVEVGPVAGPSGVYVQGWSFYSP